MFRALFVYGIPALLAGLSLWLVWGIRASLDSEDRGPPRGPALQLQTFAATYLNTDGQLLYALQAPYLVHLPGERGIEVHTPTLEIFTPEGQREWLIESEQAWLSNDHQLIVLRAAVTAERHATATDEALALHTRDLSYRRKLNLLSSDALTRLETASGWLQGTGLRADLNEGRYTLLWNVRGEYAPPPD